MALKKRTASYTTQRPDPIYGSMLASKFINCLMMHGKKALADASALYQKAAQAEPRDAMERLDVEAAKAELA